MQSCLTDALALSQHKTEGVLLLLILVWFNVVVTAVVVGIGEKRENSIFNVKECWPEQK